MGQEPITEQLQVFIVAILENASKEEKREQSTRLDKYAVVSHPFSVLFVVELPLWVALTARPVPS